MSTAATYSLTDAVYPANLAPGVAVYREVSRSGPVWLHTETPCCARPVRVHTEPGTGQHAMCCHCGFTYTVDLEQEAPDGWSDTPAWVVLFTVEHTGVVAAMHRRGLTEGTARR